jgi:hypothetical protein
MRRVQGVISRLGLWTDIADELLYGCFFGNLEAQRPGRGYLLQVSEERVLYLQGHLISTTLPPVMRTRSEAARRKMALGVPAAAQISE